MNCVPVRPLRINPDCWGEFRNTDLVSRRQRNVAFPHVPYKRLIGPRPHESLSDMPKLREIESTPWRSVSEANQRRAAEISAHLIARLDFVTDWRLQKSYYLAEVRSIEERLRRLSHVEFASWKHGPWSVHVREAEETLEMEGLVVRVVKRAVRRPEAEFLKVADAAALPPLEDGDQEFLDAFAKEIKFVDGDRLTGMAKATPPFQASKPKQLIDLDGYLENLRAKHERFVRSPKVARLVAEAKAES